jgi:hypothetical protein
MPEKRIEIHPAVAVELRKLRDYQAAQQQEIDRLAGLLAKEQQARQALEREEVHVDDMPGKQLPFKFQINIPLNGGNASPQTGTVTISRDGPFIARRLYASVLIADAPVLEVPEGTGTTIWDFSHMEGRFAPRSSRECCDYDMWARALSEISPTSLVLPPIDFEYEYNDGGSERNRQDKPISGDILAMRDEDGYFMNNEIFAAGTTISFTVHPLRAIPILTLSNSDDPPVVDEGPLNLVLKVTFDGFKVLQPLEM